MKHLVDPRRGDIEDDASSTKSNSLLAMAGSLLAEISLPKLIFSWVTLFLIPALIVGVVPVVISAWAGKLAGKFSTALIGVVPLLILAGLVGLAWAFGRRLLHLAESNFWSLNALVIEPAYVFGRELIRHLWERVLPDGAEAGRREQIRSWAAFVAGAALSAMALIVLALVWPATHWIGQLSDLLSPWQLAWVAVANTVAAISAYLAVASLAWGIADAFMHPPRDILQFAEPAPGARKWRVAHLSDVHVVGQRYAYRIESGRTGPQGDDRFRRLLDRLSDIHTADPLDFVLISGDATDAGTSGEWAAFLEALAEHPDIAERTLLLPGNHDVNIVDATNPARLDLAIGPNSRLRKIRALSAHAAVQGDRVRVVDDVREEIGPTLTIALRPHAEALAQFADTGRPQLSTTVSDCWDKCFPMVVPPSEPNGLGILLLNSNSDSHFSFTNALGVISVAQMKAADIAFRRYPDACWLIGLHHHPVEYPRPAKVLSERIGTSLVNGNWFLRSLAPMAGRAVLMHGHRHIDWVGECGGLAIVSAPSPVMGARNSQSTYFYIHTLQRDGEHLQLLVPERIELPGDEESADREFVDLQPGQAKVG
jgi:hypothetical protein